MSVPSITVKELQAQAVAMRPESGQMVHAGFTTNHGFDLLQRGAKALAASSIVPEGFQGNIANCMIALEMAQRLGASPLMVAQNLNIIHGRPAWSAKFLIASFNQCGRFTAIRYKWEGTEGKDDWGCRAFAVEKSTGADIVGPLITIALAKAEGWFERKGSKWKTIPQLMLMYRAAGWMVNVFAPEISMGLNTSEELHDTFDARATADGTFTVTAESLKQAQMEPAAVKVAVPYTDPETGEIVPDKFD